MQPVPCISQDRIKNIEQNRCSHFTLSPTQLSYTGYDDKAQDLNHVNLTSLLEAFKKNSSLKTLTIAYFENSQGQIIEIVKAVLASPGHLERLRIQNCQLIDDDLHDILSQITRYNKQMHLKELNLAHNNIVLSMKFNKRIIDKLFKELQLQVLNLNHNELSAPSLIEILQAVNNHPHLKCLGLKENPGETSQRFLEASMNLIANTRLEHLSVSFAALKHYFDLHDIGQSLKRALMNNTSLTKLSLSNACFKYKDIYEIYNALQSRVSPLVIEVEPRRAIFVNADFCLAETSNTKLKNAFGWLIQYEHYGEQALQNAIWWCNEELKDNPDSILARFIRGSALYQWSPYTISAKDLQIADEDLRVVMAAETSPIKIPGFLGQPSILPQPEIRQAVDSEQPHQTNSATSATAKPAAGLPQVPINLKEQAMPNPQEPPAAESTSTKKPVLPYIYLAAKSANSVVALDSEGNIFDCQLGGGQFCIPGNLTQISIGKDGAMWGVKDNLIYRYVSITQTWEQVQGTLKYVSVGAADHIWGINSSNEIFRYVGGSEVWQPIPFELKCPAPEQISVGADGFVWGVNYLGNIFRYLASTEKWEPVPGILKQVFVGANGLVWGVNPWN